MQFKKNIWLFTLFVFSHARADVKIARAGWKNILLSFSNARADGQIAFVHLPGAMWMERWPCCCHCTPARMGRWSLPHLPTTERWGDGFFCHLPMAGQMERWPLAGPPMLGPVGRSTIGRSSRVWPEIIFWSEIIKCCLAQIICLARNYVRGPKLLPMPTAVPATVPTSGMYTRIVSTIFLKEGRVCMGVCVYVCVSARVRSCVRAQTSHTTNPDPTLTDLDNTLAIVCVKSVIKSHVIFAGAMEGHHAARRNNESWMRSHRPVSALYRRRTRRSSRASRWVTMTKRTMP